MDNTRRHPWAGGERWRGEDAHGDVRHHGTGTNASLGAWASLARHPALCSPSTRTSVPGGSSPEPPSFPSMHAPAAGPPITVGTLTPDDVYEEDYAEDFDDDDDDDEYGDEEEFLDGETRQHRTVKLLVSGGIAGVISRSATAPLDRLKMLLQVNDAERRMTMKEGLRIMAKEGTVKSFFKGNGTNVLKIAPGTALFSVCFVVDDPGSTRARPGFDPWICADEDVCRCEHVRTTRRCPFHLSHSSRPQKRPSSSR